MAISIRTFINDEATGTLNSTYLLGLTGMRGLAAILVMLFHIVSMANPRPLTINIFGLNVDFTFIFNTGWVGIDIFFVLSGFLLGLPFIDWLNRKRDRPVTVEFYKRRCLRVLPAFYAQLIILFLLGYIGWYAKPSQFSTWLMHFFMLHNISPSASWEINGVYWTLPVEFNFYLLLPWLSYFFLHRMPNKFLAWLALLIGSMLIVGTYRYMVFHFTADPNVANLVWALGQLPGVFDQFLFGIFSAFIYRHFNLDKNNSYLSVISNCLFIFGASGTVFMMYIINKNVGVYYTGGYGLIFYWHTITAFFIGTWVIAVAMRGSISRKIFEITPVVFLGMISYSLYLWHLPILYKLKEYLLGYQANIDILPWFSTIGIALIIFTSVLSYMIIERPFLKIRHHRKKSNIEKI